MGVIGEGGVHKDARRSICEGRDKGQTWSVPF